MTQSIVKQTQSVFEKIKKTDQQGNEYWSARDLANVLEYLEFRNFKPVIDKAQEACANSSQAIPNHFVHLHEMVKIGSGAARQIEDVRLSRYACYLIVQNANPSKEVVALGQTYFAVQTRLHEIQQSNAYNQLNTEEEKRLFLRQEMTRHNKKLATAAKTAGVITAMDYAIFQNHGYKGLYGGLDAKGIHIKKSLKKSQNILDHMGSTELAANLFRATQAEEKLTRENIKGKPKANKAHFEVGKKVRKTIQELNGTMPEDLPVTDSIKKLEKKSGPQLNNPTKKKKST
jgi:DNA-damage-inducible protein D